MTEADSTITMNAGPSGVGGWLILPVIGLILTPVNGFVQLLTYTGLEEASSFLSNPQKLMLAGEIGGNLLVLIIMPVVLLVLLFQKKRSFPKLYVVWAILNLAFLFADLVAAHVLFGEMMAQQNVPLLDAETIKSLVRAFVLAVIWMPYMMISRRVRNTFVN